MLRNLHFTILIFTLTLILGCVDKNKYDDLKENNSFLKNKVNVLSNNNLEIKSQLDSIKKENILLSKKESLSDKVIIYLIIAVYILAILSLLICIIFVIILIFKGSDNIEKAIRSGTVLTLIVAYLYASIRGYSISILLFKAHFLPASLVNFSFPIIGGIAGIYFSYYIKKQISESWHLASVWVILVLTLVFCIMIDIFINVNGVPLSNLSFILSMFVVLAFSYKSKT